MRAYNYKVLPITPIVSKYVEGKKSLRQLAKEYHIWYGSIARLLQEQGIQLRTGKQARQIVGRRVPILTKVIRGGCVVVTNRCCDSRGYPIISYRDTYVRLSRVVYCSTRKLQLENIKGKLVMHTCDNPNCINSKHLVLGTHLDNMRDMWLKERGHSKLNKKKVHEIRKLWASEKYTGVQIAKMYGVSSSVIYSIRDGRAWWYV